eukprot:TRINITY_DN6691_c0_g2_i1.p1 TRINITY_DN6691_c0_g2~~TRINITY_DN6691_c0_g2_i1.p1  ORF type:complete len:490 (+),score=58.19 TRINITY_DN6691_c0_g2_i1:98-1567(+)
MKTILLFGIVLLFSTVVVHCWVAPESGNPCYLETKEEDYGPLNFILNRSITLPGFLYFMGKRPYCREDDRVVTIGFFLWRLAYTHRIYNNLTLEDVRSVNMTEYRQKFPYPYWHSINSPDSHTNRPSLVSIPLLVHTLLVGVALTLLRFLFDPVMLRVAEYIEILPNDKLRFQENCWQCLYYIFSWTFVASYVLRSDFYYDTLFIFEGDFPNQPLPGIVYAIYLLNMGWYVHGLYGLFTGLEVVKKDFTELLMHHIITLGLLYCSMMVGYWRFGVLVLYTHDLCDVFLQIPRIYLLLDNAGHFGPPEKINSMFEVAIFVPLPISWVYFRLYLYPLKVIYPAVAITSTTIPWEACDYYWCFCFGLFALLALQYFWFVLIMLIAWKKVYDGESFDDVRDRVRTTDREDGAQEAVEAVAEVPEKEEKKGRRRVRYNLKSPNLFGNQGKSPYASPAIGKSPNVFGGKSPNIMALAAQGKTAGALTGGGKSPRG